MTVAGYTLTYLRLGTTQEPNAIATRATIDVSRGGSHVTTLHPGKNTYPVEKETSNEVSIYHDPRNLGDVFLIADQIDPQRHALPEGARQAARQPHLGGRLPLRLRCARGDVAGRGRAAPPRRAVCAPAPPRHDARRSCSGPCSPLSPSLFVARPFLREPAPASDRLDEPGELERRRLELVEERDRALAALKELEFDHRTGKVTTRTTARSSARCAGGPPRRYKRSSRGQKPGMSASAPSTEPCPLLRRRGRPTRAGSARRAAPASTATPARSRAGARAARETPADLPAGRAALVRRRAAAAPARHRRSSCSCSPSSSSRPATGRSG